MSLIEVRGLKKSFGALSVLDGIDLDVEQGECISIIGGSGCGKSVFLRCLELLETPDAGSITIDGREITAPNADIDSIRRSMGMVYQKFHLFQHLNVLENLLLAPTLLLKMPRAEAITKAEELLSTVGLLSKKFSMPAVLSGGQQQRIAICRSLMMEPKIMLFDEPTSALDPTMVGEVLAVIRMLTKRNLTMLIVTHEMKFAREVSSRILFFAERGIYEQGTPDQIFDAPSRPLTISFINRQKYFHYEIAERDFDLIAMQNEIILFGEKYGLSTLETNPIQVCCEEYLMVMLERGYAAGEPIAIAIDIIYSEAERRTEIVFESRGRQFNPLAAEIDEDDLDDLGLLMLTRLTQSHEYEYVDGLNRMKFIL